MVHHRIHACRHVNRLLPFPSRRFYAMTNANGPQLIEEQILLRYSQRSYYPVQLGQYFVERYRIITKLGFGAYSTVWLAQDERFVR